MAKVLVGEPMEEYAKRRNEERAKAKGFQRIIFGRGRVGSGSGDLDVPAFELDFPDLGDGVVDTRSFRGGVPATFTRATAATTVLSNGLIGTVASGSPRSYYDPTSLTYLGYLAEGARTNLLLQSADFTNASWSKTDVTPTLSGVGPDGGANTANLLTAGTAGTANTTQAVTATADVNYALSIFAKRGNTDWLALVMSNGANVLQGWFNLNTGAVGSTFVAGTGAATAIRITSYPSGWYRLELVGSVGSGATAITVQLFNTSANLNNTRVNNSTVSVWGAQFENNVSFASSYIATVGTTVTRNADSLLFPLSPWFNNVAGTAFGEGMRFTTDTGTALLAAATDANSRLLYKAATAASTTISVLDGTTAVTKTGLPDIATASRKVISSWGAAGQTVGGSGLAAQTGAFDGAMGNGTGNLGIGCNPGGAGNEWFGTCRRFSFFPTQLPAAQQQAMSA